MILREIDKSTVYVAHLIGYNDDGEPIYTKPIETKAQISQNTKGEIVYSDNGVGDSYDLKLTFEYNNINMYIDETAIFWVNTSATDKEHNYIPLKISVWDKGLKVVHLKRVQTNWDSLWCYSKFHGFYEIQCFFDENNLNIRLPKNSFFNNTITEKIWLEKPDSVDDTTHMYIVNEYYELQDEIIYVLTKGE